MAGALLFSTAPGTVRVAVAQMNPWATPYVAGLAGPSQPLVTEMASLANQAASQRADLVVFHEGMLFGDPVASNPNIAGPIARHDHSYLVAGFAQPGRNQAAVDGPNGGLLGVYGKQHPVTFMGDHSIPTPVPVYRTRFGTLATIICYDLDFLDTAHQAAVRGARIVAVPSQDWSQVARIHYTHLVFRAIENHLTMLKADGGYDSAIIDPYGRILDQAVTPRGANQLLVATVPLGTGRTFGQHLQPWFAPLALLAGLACIVLAITKPSLPPQGS